MANDLMVSGIGGSDYSDPLYGIATPSLDLQFAANKSLTDVRSGNSLVTFTRASGGTFVDSAGVLRSAVTNLLLRSEEFGTTWTPFRATVSSNAGTAPNGQTTADTVIEDTTSNSHGVFQSVNGLINATAYTASCYVKASGRTRCRLALSGGAYPSGAAFADFNLVAITATTSAGVTAVITSVGNGWYRCSIATTTGSAGSADFYIQPLDATGAGFYLGNGTAALELWGAQLEQSSIVGEYIPTTSTINSAPRFDHNPTTGESLGLLIEEQRTNSIRNNTMVGAVAGTPGTLPTNWADSLGGLTRQVVGTGTSNGASYIDLKISGTSTGTQYNLNLETITGIAAANGQSWARSQWLAIVGGSTANIGNLQAAHNLFDSVSGFLATVGTGPQLRDSLTSNLERYSHSFTISNASTAFLRPTLYLTFASGVAIDITLRIGMPQLEQGAFATSVIPTSGTAVTRSADVASITGTNFSSWYNQAEGTVFADAKEYPFASGVSRTFYGLDASSAPNKDYIRQWIWSGASGSLLNSVYTSASGPVAAEFTQLLTNEQKRVATAVKANDFARSYNGNAAVVDAAGNLPVGIDRLGVGSTNNSLFMSGHIRRITYFPQRLSNENLQRITQ